MATNLRLRPDAEVAVRESAARTGRSQQDVIRAAIDAYLGLRGDSVVRTARGTLLAGRDVLPARTAYREASHLVPLPPDVGTEGLLDRDERR